MFVGTPGVLLDFVMTLAEVYIGGATEADYACFPYTGRPYTGNQYTSVACDITVSIPMLIRDTRGFYQSGQRRRGRESGPRTY